MRGGLRAVVAALALAFAAWGAEAQPQDAAPAPVILVADTIYLEGETRLVAEGGVEVVQGARRLEAARVTYDARAERVAIEGPLRLTDGDGAAVLVADAAALDRDLRDGLIRSARLVLDRQLQLAAARIDRRAGRYTVLTDTAVTSCQICARGRAPLWQIRARRVLHDEAARQLYFDGAQVRVFDVPVLYLPRLRLPDPTNRRARGFLVPEVRSTTQIGAGLRLPYFIPLGPHRDLTVAPLLSPETRTLSFRYRQAMRRGDLMLRGALSSDDLRPDRLRGYLFADGEVALGRGYRLTFGLKTTSDELYLAEYGVTDTDRLQSEVAISRVRRTGVDTARLAYYQSLRAGEANATLPSLVLDAARERRLALPRIGGDLRLFADLHAHRRASDRDGVGRDMARISAGALWTRAWTGAAGLRFGLTAGLRADGFRVRQDSAAAPRAAVVTPAARATLRWPLLRRRAGGARHLLEPVAMVAWSGGTRPDVPNEASTTPEFDTANLLALSRFPAADRQERGWRAAGGLRWRRVAPEGPDVGLTLGRVWRREAEDAFSATSGLDGRRSDWLVAGELDLAQGLDLAARGIIGPQFDVPRAEARARWRTERLDLSATYLLLEKDAAEGRDDSLSEWGLDGRYRLTRHWTGSAGYRYDLAQDSAARADLDLVYTNECVAIRLSASRTFASSVTLEGSTDFGLTVALKGFSTGGSAKEDRRRCN
jgi:LPS-assembly protein